MTNAFLYLIFLLSYALATIDPTFGLRYEPPSTLSKRNASLDACTQTTLDITSQCWDVLGVSDYLQEWWDKNEYICNTTYRDQGFAACYQQQLQILNYVCDNITVSSCYHPDPFEDQLTVHEYYVLYSIYGIWTWYNSIWEAASIGTLKADLPIGAIVAEINPVLPGHTSLGVVLSALSAGFAFLGLPAGGGTALKLLTAGIGQTPGLTKALLPTGSLDSELKQIDELADNLGLVLDQFQANIADALYRTETDFYLFQGASSNGSFIAKQPSLNATTNSLTKVLKTFVVSQALQANNMILTVAAGVNAYDISQRNFSKVENGTMLPQNAGHINCQEKPDFYGVCDNWWIDESSNNSFSLFKLDDMTKNFYELMEVIFTNGWTTGEDLFLGSYNCMSDDLIDWRFPFPYLSPYTLTPVCFSNLRTCAWNQSNIPSHHDGYELERWGGCTFAWPNFCIDGKGYGMNSETSNTSVSGYNYSTPGYALAEQWAQIGINNDSDSKAQLFMSEFPIHVGGERYDLVLAFNSQYDVYNNQIDTLQKQANEADQKQCKSFAINGPTPGWGGAGYHQIDDGCDIYPASYLGPGLWLDTEFCYEWRQKSKGS